LEYIPGGIFFKLIEKAEKMGEACAQFFMDQLVDAVAYLHLQGVVHRDLKPENILVGDDLNLVVSDFGFATRNNINHLCSVKGTGTYMAPEIKARKVYDGR
jgi:serine/threonine protein kinase